MKKDRIKKYDRFSQQVRRHFNGLATSDGAIKPISRNALLNFGNPPPRGEVPSERLETLASRLVRASGSVRSNLRLRPSTEVPGAYELPPNIRAYGGIPGKSARVLRSLPPRLEAQGQEGRPDRVKASLKGFAPEWVELGFHPKTVLPSTPPEIRTGKSRRILHAIYNGESRTNIYPNTWPECCVCRIRVYTQDYEGAPWNYKKRGTAFMVGPRHLITSGHLQPPAPYFGWMIEVTPAEFDGESVFGPQFYTYASDYVAYNSGWGNDLMVCRLYDPIGDTVGWFGQTVYSGSWQGGDYWLMSGYPKDVGATQPAFQGPFAVIDDDDGPDIELPDGSVRDTTQIESKADSASGASGSPVYSWFTDGQVYAIGVHEGTEEDWEAFGYDLHSTASGGVGFFDLVGWALSAWP